MCVVETGSPVFRHALVRVGLAMEVGIALQYDLAVGVVADHHERAGANRPPVQGQVFFLSRDSRLGISGGLVGGGFEMPVSTSAHPAAREDFLLPILGDFKEDFPRFGVSGHRPQRHLQDNVLPVCTRAALLAPMFAMSGMGQTRIVPSWAAEAIRRPSGETATSLIEP